MDDDHTQQPDANNDHGGHAPLSRRTLRWSGLGALMLAVLLAGMGFFWRMRQSREVQQWTHEQAIPTVSVLTPTHGPSALELPLPGHIQAGYEAPIYARVSGYLHNWYFDYGAAVKKGQLLADIDA